MRKKIFRKNIPLLNTNPQLKRMIIAASIISLAAYILVKTISPESAIPYSKSMMKAAETMEEALSAISDYCERYGLEIDNNLDPNQTGLIGPELSGIATTLGNLEAKRSTTNSNFAAVIVHLLEQAEVAPGDTIAIGCSASFPALMIATLAAAKAMRVYPVIIISLGASSFGATNPDLNLLTIYEILSSADIFRVQPAAISLGGDRDIGLDFEPEIKEQLIQQIQFTAIPFIYEADLAKNIAERMKIYWGKFSQNKISAFVNIGGSYANIGTSELVLKLKPGVNKNMQVPRVEDRGVLFEMAAQHIPIIHLLFVRGLALKYGLPWDPIPLPKSGESMLYLPQSHNDIRFWMISIGYFLMFIILFFSWKVKMSKKIK